MTFADSGRCGHTRARHGKEVAERNYFSNQKHIDELDNEFNSNIKNKGITGVNDTNTNTDIKCAKGSDDDELRDLPDLEDIVRVVNDDDDDDDEDIYKDMPRL